MTTKPYWVGYVKGQLHRQHVRVHELGLPDRVAHLLATGKWRKYRITPCDGFACQECKAWDYEKSLARGQYFLVPKETQADCTMWDESWVPKVFKALRAVMGEVKAKPSEVHPITPKYLRAEDEQIKGSAMVYNVQGPTIEGSEVKTALEREQARSHYSDWLEE